MPSGMVTSAFSFNVYRGKRGGDPRLASHVIDSVTLDGVPCFFFFVQLLFS